MASNSDNKANTLEVYDFSGRAVLTCAGVTAKMIRERIEFNTKAIKPEFRAAFKALNKQSKDISTGVWAEISFDGVVPSDVDAVFDIFRSGRPSKAKFNGDMIDLLLCEFAKAEDGTISGKLRSF